MPDLAVVFAPAGALRFQALILSIAPVHAIHAERNVLNIDLRFFPANRAFAHFEKEAVEKVTRCRLHDSILSKISDASGHPCVFVGQPTRAGLQIHAIFELGDRITSFTETLESENIWFRVSRRYRIKDYRLAGCGAGIQECKTGA